MRYIWFFFLLFTKLSFLVNKSMDSEKKGGDDELLMSNNLTNLFFV